MSAAPRNARSPLVIAHRGASGYRPEHTAEAFRLALRLGADAVEPDLVPTRDGVLLIRHESELSTTTDVAAHPDFAARRTVKEVEGARVEGWFAEDFDWDELATLRARERIPGVRPHSARFDGLLPLLRLEDLVRILDEEEERRGTRPVLVAELKHPTHFAALGRPVESLFADAIGAVHGPLVVECFEESALARVRDAGVRARYVYLMDAEGAAPDLAARDGSAAESYASQLGRLPSLAGRVDGISVPVSLVLAGEVVGEAAAAGLEVYAWTLRAENRFLEAEHRLPGGDAAHGDWLVEFREVLATGVAGVFADQPDLALFALDRIL